MVIKPRGKDTVGASIITNKLGSHIPTIDKVSYHVPQKHLRIILVTIRYTAHIRPGCRSMGNWRFEQFVCFGCLKNYLRVS